MNIKYTGIKFFICLIIITSPSWALAAQKSTAKASPQAKIGSKDNPQFNLTKNDIKAFNSSLDQNTLELRFKELLESKGFVYRKDKEVRDGNLRRMRFDKGNIAIDISLLSLGAKGTRGVMVRYPISDTAVDTKDLVNFVKKSEIEVPDYSQENKQKMTPFKPLGGLGKTPGYFELEAPVPAGSKLLKDKPPAALVGKGGVGEIYDSKNNPKQSEDFCRSSLRKQGFEEIKNMKFKVMTMKRLRFERSDMAVELFLTPKGDSGSQIIVVKYNDKNGSSQAESSPFSSVKLPKNDAGGEDIDNVPRPEGSVRWSGTSGKDVSDVSYILPISVLEAKDFYRKKMPSYGWKFENEINMRKANEDYAKIHKGKGIIHSMPIGTNLDLGEIVKDSYGLLFSSNIAMVDIAIYPNFVNPGSGCIADITYTLKKGGV